eukprot:TRINITY_DN260_c0_g1_i11.p1 TRINITY_DN260_c0_g1~~TRINITY_DN260_c0_g1_i11.p1  ORF type:complete len:315 (-),score=65.23 TRINITY_DN260_c0_g1_i11:23-967(-)
MPRETHLGRCFALGQRTLVSLNAVAFQPNNPTTFAAGGSDALLRVYDLRYVTNQTDTTAIVAAVHTPQAFVSPNASVHITCVQYSWNGKQLLGTFNDDLVYLFDSTTERDPKTLKFVSAAEPVARTASADDDDDDMWEDVEDDGDMWEDVEDHDEDRSEGAEIGAEIRTGYIQRYSGHRNNRTVKGVNFIGPRSEYVVSGSDCGHVYIWETETAELVQVIRGDTMIVNCVEPHPYFPVLAVSGIDDDIKIFEPSGTNPCHIQSYYGIINANAREREGHTRFRRVFRRPLLDEIDPGSDDDDDDADDGRGGCRTM